MILRNARTWENGVLTLRDIALSGDQVAAVRDPGSVEHEARVCDLAGRVVLPGLVNGHDHLDSSTLPALGHPPYASLYEWTSAVEAEGPAASATLQVPLADRLFLGGLRNLLAGVTAVAHHNPFHRSLARRDFPVRVLARYQFAHSPGLTPRLRKTYRTTDRRIPWIVHAAEGTDEACRRELDALIEANVLRQNTVIVHGIGLRPEDLPRIAAARACVVWCPESDRRLYGAAAPVAALRAVGVRVGLGSESPAAGGRDPLSNLAAARRAAVLGDEELLDLATRATAEVARLPVGGFTPGSPADLVVVDPLERLLEGDRSAVALVIVGGRPLYGTPELATALAAGSARILVGGEERRIEAGLGRRAAAILKRHPAVRGAAWLEGVSFAP